MVRFSENSWGLALETFSEPGKSPGRKDSSTYEKNMEKEEQNQFSLEPVKLSFFFFETNIGKALKVPAVSFFYFSTHPSCSVSNIPNHMFEGHPEPKWLTSL